MSDIILRSPDEEAVEHERRGNAMIRHAQEAVIESNEDRELAASVVSDLNEAIDLIEMEFNGTDEKPGPVTLAHRAWKSGVALREKALSGFKAAKEVWTKKIRKFEYDIEQRRLAEARKAEETARKKAEEERQRQILEAKRIGDREAVDNLKQAPLDIKAAPVKTPEVTKADGVRRSSPVWEWELVNIDAVPRQYLVIDQKAVGAIVRQLGPKHGIPGISVFDARMRG